MCNTRVYGQQTASNGTERIGVRRGGASRVDSSRGERMNALRKIWESREERTLNSRRKKNKFTINRNNGVNYL